jgi:hypothetical protein
MQNQQAQKKVTSKRNDVNLQEQQRQRQFQAQADTVNQQTEGQFTREAQDQSRAGQASSREQFITSNLPNLGTGADARPGAPTSVHSDLGRRIADALSYGRNQATSQAALGSYGANQFNNQITLNRSGQQLGQIGGNAGRSSGIAGLELEGANQAGQSNRNLGDVFRLGGQTALLYGMTQPGAVPTQAPAPVSTATPSWIR